MQKYSIPMLMAMILALFLSACGNNSQTQDTTPTLRVGLNAEYPPFEYKKDAQIVGFDVDILDALSKKVGFNYSIHHMSFDGLIPALKAGKIDMIISGMSATSERMKQVDFSIPYYEGQTLYIKRKETTELTDKESIRGKKVGAFLGTVQEQAANRMKNEYNLNVIASDAIFGAIMNLKTRKVDVVLADYATAQGYLKENPDLVGFYQESDGSEGLSIAFDKGKYQDILEQINTAIDELKASGEYDNLLKKNDLKLSSE